MDGRVVLVRQAGPPSNACLHAAEGLRFRALQLEHSPAQRCCRQPSMKAHACKRPMMPSSAAPLGCRGTDLALEDDHEGDQEAEVGEGDEQDRPDGAWGLHEGGA